MVDYKKITDFMVVSGKRLATRAGHIADIGITKADLTEEDITIERGLKAIIDDFGGEHIFYAEEENGIYANSESIWIADPISGTWNFIQGLPHYSIVVSHLINQQVVFSAVYDPAVDELFSAYLGKGAFLNGEQIHVSSGNSKALIRESMAWKKPAIVQSLLGKLTNYTTEDNKYSMAVNYCAVACGRADGIVSFTKDTFPEFAGSLIMQEAGGRFTNLDGQSNINPTDRIFIGGNKEVYNILLPLVKQAVEDN